jgi:GTP-binding protein HflX
VREADLLVHVADISHPTLEEQISIVQQTLTEIGAGNKPVIMVFNKIDLLPEPAGPEEIQDNMTQIPSLEELRNSWMARDNAPSVFISAVNRADTETLKQIMLEQIIKQYHIRFPYASGFPEIT